MVEAFRAAAGWRHRGPDGTARSPGDLLRDGGGRVSAARTVLAGARRVARILAAIAAKLAVPGRPRLINGAPGLVLRLGGSPASCRSPSTRCITAIDVIRNPEKLRALSGLT